MRRGRAFDGTRFHYSLYMLLLFFLILAIHPLNLTSCVKAQGPEEDVVINEIMLLPGEGGVWIEIHNTGNEFVSLDEWLISDEDGLTYQLPNLPDMPPQSYIVVHFDSGESDIEFGQTQPNALHIYTGWKNVRFTRHFVDSDERAARCAVGHDMVTGGKPEVLVNKFKSGKFFYESKADMSDEWIRSDITAPGDPSETHRIKPIDVDGDTDTDIVAIYCFVKTIGEERLYWIESPPDPKNNWGGPYLIDDMEGLVGLDSGDINGDTTMDVIVSRSEEPNHNIYWYECTGDPVFDPWNRYTIDNTLVQPGGLMLSDLDDDGDMDIVACGSWGEEVVWYEHPDNPGDLVNPWPKHIIATPEWLPGPAPNPQFDSIGELIVRDLDGDSKLDVVVSEGKRNRVVWYNYSSTPFDTWTQHVIDEDVLGPSGLDTGDVDGDGDPDVMVAATSGIIAWYPQPPSNALYNQTWPRYIVDDSLHLPFYVNATDLDNDGDLDITTADQSVGKILWYENEFLNFTMQDQCALFKAPQRTQENIIDFVAWGAPSGVEDDLAVDAGIWQADTFMDMTGSQLNQTLARDRFSQDADVPGDWDVLCGFHSDIPTPGTVNYPYPTNIELSMEYNPILFAGGGIPPESMPRGLCLANYSSYTFIVNVTNPFGWCDLELVELILDPNGANVKITWTQVDNNFTINDPSNYITLISKGCLAQTDNTYVWQLNFTVFFHWWYPTYGLQNASVTCQNSHGYQDIDYYDDFFNVVKSLTFTGEMLVYILDTQELLDDNDWVIPGLELQVKGPIVIYDVQDGNYFPSDSQFNVTLWDSLGNYWLDLTSSGFPVNITASVPEDATTGPYDLTLEITDIPQGANAITQLTHGLRVDADFVQFASPLPDNSIWHINNLLDCSVMITDFSSGVSGETIEYRVANGSLERFGDWISAQESGTNTTMEPEISYLFSEGPNNWIQWRAKDAAGNGPTLSPPYRIHVDTLGVTYHDFYPSPLHVYNTTNVTVTITIADFGGSGVDLSSIEVAIKPAGEGVFGNWFDPGFIILEQTPPTTGSAPSGPETVQISTTITDFQSGYKNYIKFRAWDMAGCGPVISSSFQILVDTHAVTYHDFTPSPSPIYNTNNVTVNITIADFGGSGVNLNSVEVSVKPACWDVFSDWYNPGFTVIDETYSSNGYLPSGPETMRISTTITTFRNGTENYIKFRAYDLIGNGPTISPSYQILVDTKRVTYHDFNPPSHIIHNDTNVTVNITIADFGGSGVEINSLQVAIKPTGGNDFSDWFDPGFEILNQTPPSIDSEPSGPETVRFSLLITGFQNGTENYIKFRSCDMAGSGFSESGKYKIQISIYDNITDGTPSDDSEPDDSGPDDADSDDTDDADSDDTLPEEEDTGPKLEDYWPWLLFLLIILAVLVIFTLWNYHRLTRDKDVGDDLGDEEREEKGSEEVYEKGDMAAGEEDHKESEDVNEEVSGKESEDQKDEMDPQKDEEEGTEKDGEEGIEK